MSLPKGVLKAADLVPSQAGHFISATFRRGIFIRILSSMLLQIKFASARSTCRMSLCETELVSPSSQRMVTSLQDVPVTVPRSVVEVPQRTLSPAFKSRDWSPVM